MLIFALIVLLSGALVAYGAYRGWRRLQWAKVLKDPIPLDCLAAVVGQTAAVRGQPEELPSEVYDHFKVLYLHIDWQQRSERPGGHRNGWESLSREVKRWDFVIHDGRGHQAVIRNDADEASGTMSVGGSPGDGLGTNRKVRTYLPFNKPVTVLGKVTRHPEYGFQLVRDEALGMLLSGRESETQAFWESVKGWIGLLVLPLLWIVGCVVAYQNGVAL